MSRKDAVLLTSRVLAFLLLVWAITDATYLPERVNSYLHHSEGSVLSATDDYWRHFYLVAIGFLLIRVIGSLLLAVWFCKGSPEVEQLLLPTMEEHAPVTHASD
jgi:hypothetical protein